MICGIGALNHHFKDAVGGCGVKVEGETRVCPHPMEPLELWATFRYPIQAGYTVVSDICLACYKAIFDEEPMPSTYAGYAKGRYMTRALADEAFAAAAKNYEVDWDALVPAQAPEVPELAASGAKPALERQGARFFSSPRK